MFKVLGNADCMFLRSLVLATCLIVGPVFGHSGGLDSSGCHGGSRPYHCHRAPSEMVGNRLRCDLGSRSQDCNGGIRSNDNRPSVTSNSQRHGAIASVKDRPESLHKYQVDLTQSTVPLTAPQIKKIQHQLKLLGLYDGAIDGVFGPATALAMDIYSISKGFEIGNYHSPAVLNSLDIK